MLKENEDIHISMLSNEKQKTIKEKLILYFINNHGDMSVHGINKNVERAMRSNLHDVEKLIGSNIYNINV